MDPIKRAEVLYDWPEQLPRLTRLRNLIDRHTPEAQAFMISRSFAEELYRELKALTEKR